ncbi:MAG: PD-(D/E)XK nuclease domain-containing protein, partial [Methanobrevibacter sp.]|nr:PD-(D/E)XK nuclease domain-containing protein [Methanobrevibacter sp.]
LTWLDEMGMRFDGEKTIGHGVIDTVIEENDDHVAVVEIKYSEDPKKSLDSLINESFKQIHEKEYYLPYEDRDVSLIALAFKDRPIKNGIITDVKCKIDKLSND